VLFEGGQIRWENEGFRMFFAPKASLEAGIGGGFSLG